MLKTVEDSTFEKEVLESKIPVLVKFGAEWCGPCKTLRPTIEELADEIGDTVKILELDIDSSPSRPTQLGIKSIPALILFNQGKIVDQKIGAISKQQLKDWIDSSLKAV